MTVRVCDNNGIQYYYNNVYSISYTEKNFELIMQDQSIERFSRYVYYLIVSWQLIEKRGDIGMIRINSEFILEKLKEMGLSQGELAFKSGVSSAFMTMMLASKAMPSVIKLKRIALILEVKMDDLIIMEN